LYAGAWCYLWLQDWAVAVNFSVLIAGCCLVLAAYRRAKAQVGPKVDSHLALLSIHDVNLTGELSQ